MFTDQRHAAIYSIGDVMEPWSREIGTLKTRRCAARRPRTQGRALASAMQAKLLLLHATPDMIP